MEFRDRLTAERNRRWPTAAIAAHCGVTSLGQEYGFLVLPCWRGFSVLLITGNKRDDPLQALKVCNARTQKDAESAMQVFVKNFEHIDESIYAYDGQGTIPLNGDALVEIQLPTEYVAVNPDNFLLPGDSILVERTALGVVDGFFHHAAIYAGDRHVYQFLPYKIGNIWHSKCAKATWDEFLNAKTDQKCISKCVKVIARTEYILRVFTAKQILERAQKFTDASWGTDEYALCCRNCQHFAALCATGHEFSVEVHEWRRRLFLTSDGMPFGERIRQLIGHIKKGLHIN